MPLSSLSDSDTPLISDGLLYGKKLCNYIEMWRPIAQQRVCNAILDAPKRPSAAPATASGRVARGCHIPSSMQLSWMPQSVSEIDPESYV